MARKTPKRLGPKPKEMTTTFVFGCGKLHMTQDEIGALCGLSQERVSQRLNSDPELREAFLAGKADLAKRLRAAQIKSALGTPDRRIKLPDGSYEIVKGRLGNPVSQIWLGKQLLKQTDHSPPPSPAGTTNIFIAQWGGTQNPQIPQPQSPSQPVLPSSDDHDYTDKCENPDSVIDAEADEIPPDSD